MVTGALLRGLALLAATAASVAMFAQTLRAPWLSAFVSGNQLSLHDRIRLIELTGAAACAGALFGAVLAWRCGTVRVRCLAHALAPLALLGFVPPLCLPSAWPSALNAVSAIAVLVLLAQGTFRLAFEAWVDGPGVFAPGDRLLRDFTSRLAAFARRGIGPSVPAAVVVVAAAGYSVYMSVHTIWMHGRFQTYGYDLGQYDAIFWGTLHGHPFRDAPLGRLTDWSELANHADLSTLFFLPFYAIKPGAPALLVIQSCVLGLGAIPIFRFASRRLSRASACVIALAYLFYPPLHGLQFYDFHFQPIASTFVLLVIDFVDERRYWPCALAFVVAIGCREDVSIGLSILGVFLVMSGHRVAAGVAIAVSASAYFFIIRFVVMPYFGPTWFQDIYKDLFPPGNPSFGGVIETLLSNPPFVFNTLVTADKLRYALQILAPLAFLPLRRGYLAASLIHGSLLTLLTTQYGPTIDIGFQYAANFIPYVFPAAALALEATGDASRGRADRFAALGAMVVGTAFCSVLWGAIPPRSAFKGGFVTMSMTPPTAEDRKRDRDLVQLASLVPVDAWLAVSEQELPHVSRVNMKSLRDTLDADYFLYGTRSGFLGSDNADRLIAAGTVEKLAERPGLVLLRRKDLAPADPDDIGSRARWRASSALVNFATSGIGERWPEPGHGAFFHTVQEPSPWIEFDVGKSIALRSFQVVNRLDCCQDRAFPLVAETSTDGVNWVEVVRQEARLDTWEQDFHGQVARYVRFRALRNTLLHFASVKLR